MVLERFQWCLKRFQWCWVGSVVSLSSVVATEIHLEAIQEVILEKYEVIEKNIR